MAERNRPGDAGDPADDEVYADAVADDEEPEDDEELDDDQEPVSRGGTAVKERTKGSGQPKAKKEVRRTGLFGRIGGFFREVVSELRKVIWPTRKELITYTTIVIGFVTVMTTVVGLLDYGLGKGILWAFGG
jgi:preprotein translocase subunit SecE